jgi:hypothetical protein
MSVSDDLMPVEPPRALSADERALIDRLLHQKFRGRDELYGQLADCRIIAESSRIGEWADARTIVFTPSPNAKSRAQTALRVPVEASMTDNDGTEIEILLHVVDGEAKELEIYRVDGEPIQLERLEGPLKWIIVNED